MAMTCPLTTLANSTHMVKPTAIKTVAYPFPKINVNEIIVIKREWTKPH